MAGRALHNQQLQFYRPYDSEDESGSDSDTYTDDSWFYQGMDQQPGPVGVNEEGIPNFRAFASRVQLIDAAGRSFSTIRDEVRYGVDALGRATVYSEYEPPPPAPPPPAPPAPPAPKPDPFDTNARCTQPGSGSGAITTLCLMDSRYRDRVAYPQPTYLSLKLPRVYRNVTNITLSDIKLLNSFYFFRLDKGNTDITVYEKDRLTYTYEGTLQSTIVKRYIPDGSYNITSLLNQIEITLNYTPLFYDYVNGFNDFIGLFRASGDFSLNFNDPGDYFYNNTTNAWEPDPTIESITTHFWPQRFAGLTSYTVDQVLLAYYYPVLNEYLYDETYLDGELQYSDAIAVGYNGVNDVETVDLHIKYSFLGISPTPDPVVLAMVKQNRPLLDRYRLNHTFRYWLINRYIVGLDTRSQNVFITSPSLNTSLVRLLDRKRAQFFAEALARNGLDEITYAELIAQTDRLLAVLLGMYNYEQSNFLDYFAVPWSLYTLSYYANLNYQIYLQNGLGATGIPSNDAEAVDAGINPISNDILLIQKNNPVYYWPNLSSTFSSTVVDEDNLASTIYMVNLSTATENYTKVYNMNTCNFFPDRDFIDSNTQYLYTENLTLATNVVCPIQAGKYTVFKFRSPLRQTLQVETLPRPTQYRIINYNQSNYDSTINAYFDLSYVYQFNSSIPYVATQPGYQVAFDNIPSTVINTIPGWDYSNALSTATLLDSSWARNFSTSEHYLSNSYPVNISLTNRSLYLRFVTPQVSTIAQNSSFTYSLNLAVNFYADGTSFTDSVCPVDYQLFLYRDRSAFQADALFNRQENPIFYLFSTQIGVGTVSDTFEFTTYPNTEYFVTLRADSTNFPLSFVRVFPYFTSSFTITPQSLSVEDIDPANDVFDPDFIDLVQTNFNYAQVYDPDFLHLPIDCNVWQSNPSGNFINNTLQTSNTPIGYIQNYRYSTDFTDYVPYIYNSLEFSFFPTCNIAIDPITQNLFSSNSPYDTDLQEFLYPGSLSALYGPGLSPLTITSSDTVQERQYKISHYYSPNYIEEPDLNFALDPSLIRSTVNGQLPYTVSSILNGPIPGYTYGGGEASTLQLGRGVLGFSFIPEDGVWDLQQVVFRSAISDYTNDPNQEIRYLGVYNMSVLLIQNTAELSLSTALTVLSSVSRVTYTSNLNLSTFGFDVKGGTYYEFRKVNDFESEWGVPILGYSQNPNTISDQPESMYSIIAFNEYGIPTPIKALSGSTIPYPYYNNPYASTTYLDGTRAFNSNQGVVFPSTVGATLWPFTSNVSTLFAPAPDGKETQSAYVLSMPIGTSVLAVKGALDLSVTSNFFFPWETTLTPTSVVATVPNFVMLQDTNFNIYEYNPNDINYTFDIPNLTLSPDQIFPTYEQTSVVWVAGNTQFFYFLGLSNTGSQFALRLKRIDPTVGILYEYPLDASFVVPYGGIVKGFQINDSDQFVFAYQETNNITYLNFTTTPPNTMVTTVLPSESTITMSMDPTTSDLYYIPLNRFTNFGNEVYKWKITDPIFSLPPGTPLLPSSITSAPTEWSGIAVNASNQVPQSFDRIYMYSLQPGYESNVYYNSNTSSAVLAMALISTPIVDVDDIGQPITSITNGFEGGVWLTATSQPIVWGNRNTLPDINGPVETAWQIFYPWQKLVFTKIANSYNPIVDLTYLDYPEYPHTAIFAYSNEQLYNRDTKHRWGVEDSNNFLVGDPFMSGYYFNSYVLNVPLKESPPGDPNQAYFITVRGFCPTETSEVLLRFNLPNKYYFGFASQLDMINEISLLSTTEYLFDSNYAYTLSNFDLEFIQSNSFFGQGLLPGFLGSNYDTNNFQQFASNVSTLYVQYATNAGIISTINYQADSNLQYFISTQLRYIIPATQIGRTNYTDPIVFKLLWKSGLLPQYRDLLDNWGLGYNLGYAKLDTEWSTYHRASSFFKILEEYIFLRLNPEFQMNRLDTTFLENFNKTRDPTGQVQNLHGKLYLSAFGTFSTTFVYNPQVFNPPIGRLDTMYFDWTDILGTTLDNNDCEWTCSVVITEACKS
jgi:hypothetical protein